MQQHGAVSTLLSIISWLAWGCFNFLNGRTGNLAFYIHNVILTANFFSILGVFFLFFFLIDDFDNCNEFEEFDDFLLDS